MNTIVAMLEPPTNEKVPIKDADTTSLRGTPVRRLVKYVLYDILQNRILLAYTAFLLLASLGMFQLNDDPTKALVSLLNIVLIVTPLVGLVFSTIYYYNAYEFIELLASQPVKRSVLLWSEFIGLSVALSTAAIVGIGIPVLCYAPGATGLTFLGVSVALSTVFAALALLASVLTRDKAKGIGLALWLWFFFSFLYDAFVLFLMFSFADYPFEKAMLLLTCLHPLALSRVLLSLKTPSGPVPVHTGAVFQEWLGSGWGIFAAGAMLVAWISVPLWLVLKAFRNKDL